MELRPVSAVTDAVEVSIAGDDHGCARTKSGRVTCCPFDILKATPIAGIEKATQLAGACAVVEDGHLRCWNANKYPERAFGTTYVASYPP